MPKPPLLTALLSALVLASCGDRARDADEPFVFAMVVSEPLDVDVRSSSGPVSGALVYVRAEAGGPPLWQGVTGPDGHARGAVARPVADGKLAVVVQHPRFVGPWTAPEPRETFGPFAPSSWEVTPARELASHVVFVEERR